MKDLALEDDERLVAKRYPREAELLGLIKGIEPVLGAVHVTNALNEHVRALQRADIFIFEQVMRIEGRLDNLKASSERYRKYQMYSPLIGIALQIIPIVGVAAAGIT